MTREIKYRVPHQCQNGHFRYLYWEPVDAGTGTKVTWGEKHPDCNCPTGAIGEGFAAIGWHEQCLNLPDKNSVEIYENDLITHPRRQHPHSGTGKVRQVLCQVVYDSGKSESNLELNPRKAEDPSLFNQEPTFRAFPVDDTTKESRWGCSWSEFSECEVVGNIHTHPHLLKK